jgi:hypothetical protein
MAVDRRNVRLFYEQKFKRKAIDGDPYFEEWVDRFETGRPYSYMDSTSLKVWLKMVKKNNPESWKKVSKVI